VLAGHSYGVAVITNAAVGNPNVKALVYVNAFIPDAGDTVLALATAVPGSQIGGDPTTVFDFVPYPGATPRRCRPLHQAGRLRPRLRQRRITKVRAGHMSMLSQPDTVEAVIGRAAR
jgi:pimeloyl-ACP methyl ester carboxylesterase